MVKYWITHNYQNKSFNNLNSARKYALEISKTKTVLTVPIIDDKNRFVGNVHPSKFRPTWVTFTKSKKFDKITGKEYVYENEWILNKDGTLKERIH